LVIDLSTAKVLIRICPI